VFSLRSPTQHALFLEHAAQLNIQLTNDADVQENFDHMHGVMFELLNQFYPEREI